MLFASIDIGSNAVRLLFANAFERDKKTYIEKATLVRIPVRLGKDVFSKNKISEKKIKALIKTLEAFKLLLEVYRPVAYMACATSAMREAVNGREVIKRIKQEVGLKVKIIDGQEEAGAISGLNWFKTDDGKLTLYIDVGGGSTEMSVLSGDKIISTASFNIGTLRYYDGKIKDSKLKNIKKWLMQFKEDFDNINVIGTGGNINKIKKIYGTEEEHFMRLSDLEHAHLELSRYTVEERMEMLGLRIDRADVIVPASEIFLYIMKLIKAELILVPKVGLADGLILKLYNNYSRRHTKSPKPD
jgi:exopolyphosphatase/guanosine-5'-triphosphate,3'-diphosphate pyrophosphatase